MYVPAQHDTTNDANLLVFQDGARAVNPEGALRVPQVLEILIHKGDIPVTIGVFITPGQRGRIRCAGSGHGTDRHIAVSGHSAPGEGGLAPRHGQ